MFDPIATQAHRAHIAEIREGRIRGDHVQFDEMVTFQHSKHCPVGVAIAVQSRTGRIIDIEVGLKSAHSARGKNHYEWNVDQMKAACESVIQTVSKCVKPGGTIVTDGLSMYEGIITREAPHARHVAHIRDESTEDDHVVNMTRTQKQRDPLFMVNHTCAKLRADIASLARRTWTTCKKLERLQDHLLMYIAFQNGYQIV